MITAKKLYKGKIYNIYAIYEDDKCFVEEFISKLKDEDKKKVFALLQRSADVGIPENEEKFKKLSDKIWEFKSYQVRIFCTFEENKIILLIDGFIKKKSKTPKNEIERAKKLLKKYLEYKNE